MNEYTGDLTWKTFEMIFCCEQFYDFVLIHRPFLCWMFDQHKHDMIIVDSHWKHICDITQTEMAPEDGQESVKIDTQKNSSF